MGMDNKETQPLTKQDLEELRINIGNDLVKSMHQSLAVTINEERKHTERSIKEAIREATCDCPMTECQKHMVPSLFGLLNDFGDGEPVRGLLEIRKNHVWTSKIRRKSDSYGTSLIVAFIIIIVGGVSSAIYHGFKVMLGNS